MHLGTGIPLKKFFSLTAADLTHAFKSNCDVEVADDFDLGVSQLKPVMSAL
jgi:hypothetical protein